MTRIGIDVGGTFTDFVLAAPGGGAAPGRTVHHKEPSTPHDPAAAVITGLTTLLNTAGTRPETITGITHGTTIGLNAIIRRRGARLALVVTDGYRDLLEIGRSRMPSFDLYASKEPALVPRDRVTEIAARLHPDGHAAAVPDGKELDRVAAEITAGGADAAALTILHAHTNPGFEAEIAAGLSARAGIPVAASATVWPEIREYERTLVTLLNASITPLMRDYLARLEAGIRDLGITAPVHIAASNGGSIGIAAAAERPIETVLSGPSSGVTAAVNLAGGWDIVTFDMGGTSSDIAVATGGEPEFATHTTIGGLPLILPVVAVSAIGAGGGSIVSTDPHGMLAVGPDSAGADPGPAAYGRGGAHPTITDCYLVAGFIDPDRFLGGRIALDALAAEQALAGLADPRQVGGAAQHPAREVVRELARELADGALKVATAGMATELRKILAQRGLDPADFTLVPYGGARPVHAALLAAEAGIATILIPPTAATFCALGAAGADLRRDFARSIRLPLDDAGHAEFLAVLASLRNQARAWAATEEAAEDTTAQPELAVSADISYLGQAYELRIPLPDPGTTDAGTADAIARAFHAEHERLYGFRDETATIRLGTVRLAATIRSPELATPPAAPAAGASAPSSREIRIQGERSIANVYRRDQLRAGDRLTGPAIVEQDDTTVLIPPRWRARTDETGNLWLDAM
jgi:N-methylhydantoinase A